MTKIKVRHYVVKRGKGFWQPTRVMRSAGFYSVPCGPDGPDAWERAEEWNRRWDLTRRGEAPSPALVAADNLSPEKSEELTVYPPRSFGEAFRRYRRTNEWARKAPRTREDWWRGWRRIKPVFADCDPRTVTLEDISAWRAAIEETVSLREAHRALKILCWPSTTPGSRGLLADCDAALAERGADLSDGADRGQFAVRRFRSCGQAGDCDEVVRADRGRAEGDRRCAFRG